MSLADERACHVDHPRRSRLGMSWKRLRLRQCRIRTHNCAPVDRGQTMPGPVSANSRLRGSSPRNAHHIQEATTNEKHA